MSKELSFNYFCDVLISRYDELWLEFVYKDSSERFWRLGIMKMLFFAVVSETWNKTKLLEIFNNWSALPNGPVELDCYNFIRAYSFSTDGDFEELLHKRKLKTVGIWGDEIALIKKAIESIPTILFTKKTFELVELSHRYKSWKDNFQIALSHNSRAHTIKVEEIKNESILEVLF